MLVSVPGVGTATARTLLAELPELGMLDRHRVVALAGLAPYNRDSGPSRGKRAIAGGRANARAAPYMAAVVGIRFNPRLKAVYDRRLVRAGKARKVAIVAVMRKLLVILNAMLRDRRPWASV